MSSSSSSIRTKFGVYIPPDLMKELDEIMKSMGIDNRSKFLQEAVRAYIIENKWITAKNVVGAFSILYNHEVGDVDKELTDVQHDFLDVIIATMHVHLDKEKCMLLMAVRGPNERVRELLGRIHKIRGVLLVRPVLMEVA